MLCQVCEELHRQVSVVRQQDEGSEVTVDTLFTFIPGVCYTRLLQSLPLQVLPGLLPFCWISLSVC